MGLFRLFLALVVAYDHWRAAMLFPAGESAWPLFGFNAGHAVLFFYAISGFLITYTLTMNYSADRAGRLTFYKNRFIRIFSLYWPVVALAMFIVPPPNPGLLAIPQFFIVGQDWLLVFGRYFGLPDFAGNVTGLNQSWTLGAELTFYLVAPFLIRSIKAALIACACSILIRLAFLAIIGDAQAQPYWTYYFFPSTACFFLFGQLACLLSARWPQLRDPMLAWLTPAIFVVLPAILVVQYKIVKIQVSYFDGISLWLPMAMFVVSLPALFEVTKNNRVSNYLGNFSYPLYLTHILAMMLFHMAAYPLLQPLGPLVTTGGYILVALMIAAIAHHAIEVPTAYAMKRLFKKLPTFEPRRQN